MNELCAFNGCRNHHFKVGLCEPHYAALAKEALRETKADNAGTPPPFWRAALYLFNRFVGGSIDAYRSAFQLREADLLQMYIDEADAHLRNGALPQATEVLERAVAIAPEDPTIHLQLGIIHTGTGDFERAVASLRRVQELLPDHEELDERLGEALSGLGQHDEAIERLSRAAAKAPNAAERQYRLGTALEAAGRPAEAVAAFERAGALKPTEPRYQQALGFVYEATGEHEGALRCFKKAIELER